MIKKESFVIYKSFYAPIKKLSDQNLGILFRALFEYQIDGKEPDDDSEILMPFEFFKNQFGLDAIKYQKVVDRNKENGKKGGRPKTQENPKNPVGYEEPKKADNGNDKVTVKEKEKETVKDIVYRKSAFADSIRLLNENNDLKIDYPILKEFYDYWTEHGEKDKKMRFEKQTSFSLSRRLSTWLKNEKKFNPESKEKKGKVDDDYMRELKQRLS